MCLLAVILCGTIAVQVVAPLVASRFIDRATAGGAMRDLIFLALLTMGLALVGQGVAVAETYVAENVSWAATNALRADLVAHLLRLDATFHTAHTPGELIERVDGDVATLARFFSRFVVYVLGNGVLIAGRARAALRRGLADRPGAERLRRAGLGRHAAHPRRRHALLGGGAPGERRFLRLPGRIPGRAGGYPLQRGGRVRAAPLRRGDAVVAGRDAQGADAGLRPGRHQPGAVRARHGRRLCPERHALPGRRADHRHRLPDLPVHRDAAPADRADPQRGAGPATGGRQHRPGRGAARHGAAPGRWPRRRAAARPAGGRAGRRLVRLRGGRAGPARRQRAPGAGPRAGCGRAHRQRQDDADAAAPALLRSAGRRGAPGRRRSAGGPPRGGARAHRPGHPGGASLQRQRARQPDPLRRRRAG